MELKINKLIITSDKEDLNTPGSGNENTDVIVILDSGKKFIASFFSYKYLIEINHEHTKSGEFLNGNYFWDKNMVLVKDCSRDIIKPVVNDLIEEGNFEKAFLEL